MRAGEDAKFIFFTGKGGVGKTSMACAEAVYNAKMGIKTLIVTTDPASNLKDVFERDIGHKVTSIENDLWAMEIDPDEATQQYKNGIIEPMRQVFPREVVSVVEEQLASPCTEEVAAFDKFVGFMNQAEYDLIIFDTAPTGHTLRLLQLPLDWKKAIELSEAGSGQTCIGPVQTLQESKSKYEKAVNLMRSPQAKFVFVLQPESTSIYETKRSIDALATIGIVTDLLIVNGILPQEQCLDAFFRRRSEMQQRYLKRIEEEFRIPILRMGLLDTEVKGLQVLEKVGGMLHEDSRVITAKFAK